MRYKFVMVPPNLLDHWPEAVAQAVPECDVHAFDSAEAAHEAIVDADAAYGTIGPDLFARAQQLRWICAPQAGLGGGWFHPALVASDVVVTNSRGIFNDHLSHHVLGLILAHSRHFDAYGRMQHEHVWGEGLPIQHLPDSTLLVVGCGEAGAATCWLAKQFGMTTLATDPRRHEAPPGVDELHPPEKLLELLPRADYVTMIVPETPDTLGMFAREQMLMMKPDAYLINVGRGKTLLMDDLVEVLNGGHLSGASLDVFETEPLPPDHPLWDFQQVRITPHVSGEGPHCWERRLELLIENARRFAAGEPLLNVVDKGNWF